MTADRSDDGFTLMVNGVPVFCRGAGWYPIDPVGLQATDVEIATAVELTRAAGCNMLRIPGGTVYEDDRFFTRATGAGIMVWQDAMLGPLDPPEDDAFIASVDRRGVRAARPGGTHPSLAVFCGGQEMEEQPAMFGLSRDRWRSPMIHSALPDLIDRVAPGLVYVPSSPSGGALPFQWTAGVSHYAGVGVFCSRSTDLRRAGT